RLSFESPPLRELFDQVHVLNEGRLASRYFPATGLWLAPWLAAGQPGWGWWVAEALLTGLVYLWGKELAGPLCGLLAATLCALSPGLVLFSQLLLAHHPTLLGLAVFHWASLKALRGPSGRWAACAGVGLAWAMLCRPMTAAGAALPLGLWLLWQGLWHRRLLELWLPLGLPLVAGLAVQVGCDLAITGEPFTTPYGLYTRLHTPRHQYGFNNVVRGERQLGPRVHAHYDQWAENLTGELAWQNVQRRLWASGQWTLGVLPLLFAVGASLAGGGGLPPQFRWLPASIVSLHVVHIPYWFSGIFHFHYVFETLVLWLVWLAVVGVTAARDWRRSGRTLLPAWGALALLAAVVLCYTLPQGLWHAPFLAGRSQLEFARRKHANFEAAVAREVTQRPALVLVEPDPADRHLDFVTNLPPLTGPVLVGRYRPDLYDRSTIVAAFPERTLYRYRVTTGELFRWRAE
ncbi:MAG: glycosyltransferase family 39 protein, partial [Planctomycetaceae bacterium]